jgi:hypothetical protein
MLVSVEKYGQRVKQLEKEPALDSGDYRHGFSITEKRKVPGGTYTIIVSTFTPGQVGEFKLSVTSSLKLMIKHIT